MNLSGSSRPLSSTLCWDCSRTNNTEDYVVEQSSGLHVTNLSGVSGKELFRDTQYMVRTMCTVSA